MTTPTVGVAPTDTFVVADSPSTGDTTTYVNYPNSNSGLDITANSCIQRIISYANGSNQIRWASGDLQFNKVWANRAGYNYDYIKQ
jgi:hypothetical protein